MTKGDIIELDKVAVVTVVWCNETLMQVEYKDLTRRLLKIADYEIKILSGETRKDFENENCEVNIPVETCVFRLNEDCRGCVHYKE